MTIEFVALSSILVALVVAKIALLLADYAPMPQPRRGNPPMGSWHPAMVPVRVSRRG